MKTLSLLVELAVYLPHGGLVLAANARQRTRPSLVSCFDDNAMSKTISFLRRKLLQRDPVHSGVGAVQVLFRLTLSASYAEHRFLLIKD